MIIKHGSTTHTVNISPEENFTKDGSMVYSKCSNTLPDLFSHSQNPTQHLEVGEVCCFLDVL